MTVYTVHIHPSEFRSSMTLVKDGFSWGAAIFGFVWALFIGAWRLALLLVVAQTILAVGMPMLIDDGLVLTVIDVGTAVVLGLVANELRRLFLRRQGLIETDVVSAPNEKQAEQRFLDQHPDVTARLLRAL